MPFLQRSNSFENALAACLDDLETGLPLEEILARYPQYAADLGPLLAVAGQMRSAPWPALSVRGRVQGRERMHAALAKYHSGFTRWRPSWVQAAMALIIVVDIIAASVIVTRRGLPTPSEPPALLAPISTATPEQPVVTPDDTATATPTAEPSATPALQIATATSTLTVTTSLDSKLATVTLSPSLEPSATSSPRATVTLRPTQTVLPTATLDMHANDMSQTPRPTNAEVNPPGPRNTPTPGLTSSVPTQGPVGTRRAPSPPPPPPTPKTQQQPTAAAAIQPTSEPPAPITPQAVKSPDPKNAATQISDDDST